MPTRRVFMASALALAVAASGAAKRGATAEDYFAFELPSDAHISPDGQQVAYVVTTIDQKANRRRTAVWAVAADGNSAPRRLTADAFNSNAPRWSPDGTRLAFLSSRNRRRRGSGRGPAPPDLDPPPGWWRSADADESKEWRDFLPVVAGFETMDVLQL